MQFLNLLLLLLAVSFY